MRVNMFGNRKRHQWPILIGIAMGAAALADAANPWPTFRGDMQHTGRTTQTSSLRPVLNWAAPTSGSIAGSPVMNSTGTIFVASASGHVYAYDRDGTRLWTFPTSGAIFGSPTIGPNGTIYVGDLAGRLYAILPGGTEDWSYTINNGGRDARILQAPGVGADGRIYVCSWDGDVHCLTPDGTHQWAHSFGGYVSASPAIDSAGTVYVVGYRSDDGDNLRVRAINPNSSTKWTRDDRDMGSWNYQKQTYIKSSVCVDEARGRLYVGANCPIAGYLWCLNLSNGTEVRWTTVSDSIYSAPAVDSAGIVYFGALDGKLYAYDPATGVEQWNFQTDGLFVLGSPLIDRDGFVYIGATDGALYKIAPGGSEVWRFATNSDVRSTPVIDENGVLYFGSMDRSLYSIGGPSAVTHWQQY